MAETSSGFTSFEGSALFARAKALPVPNGRCSLRRACLRFVIAVKSDLDGGKVGEMNRRQSRTITQLVEIFLATCRDAEVQRGKPFGVHAKNAIAKRLVKNYRVDIVTPVVLTAMLDFRTLL